MKNIFLTIFFLFSILSFSQNIFKYEKEIDSIDNYYHEEINFKNTSDKIELSGTLIAPKNGFGKIVVIIPGSGKDTRHSHFILTENLIKNGVAVYRFDERGVGKSEGKYSELSKDLSNDLNFMFKELKLRYNTKKIGLLGHSLGGIAILESIHEKINPDFIVLIEAPIVKKGDFVLNQIEMDFEKSIPQVMQKGRTKVEIVLFLKDYFNLISNYENSNLDKAVLKEFIKERGFNKKFIMLVEDPFLIEMLNKNVEEVLKNISIPTLYLTGTKGKVINYIKETDLIKSFNNKNIDLYVIEGLNHYLTEKNAPVGTSLYKMDSEALNHILKWILNI